MAAKKTLKEERINLRISPDLKRKATKAAQADGRSLSAWIVRLIEANC